LLVFLVKGRVEIFDRREKILPDLDNGMKIIIGLGESTSGLSPYLPKIFS